MKIVILDGYTENPGDLSWEKFERLGTLTVYERTKPEEVISRIGDAEIVITNKVVISKNVLDSCTNIRYIGVIATGYNVVDLHEATKRKIVVTNIPDYSTNAVAQFTFALLLELCHHVGEHSQSVRDGNWINHKDFCFWNFPMVELAGKTMGILGFGKIGQAVARIAIAMGMNVCVVTRSKPKQPHPGLSFVSLEKLYKVADVISLHCPLTETNIHMMNRHAIAKMKDGVFLINTARGPLIEEQDLADALNSGKVAGAALDVISTEPMEPDNPLRTAKNCIITPHIAWAPIEARARLMDIAVNNLVQFLEGNPINVVNSF